MSERRYHIEVEPGCVATFNTPTPNPETIRILKDVIRMAMEFPAQGIGVAGEARSERSEDGTHAKPGAHSDEHAPKEEQH